MASCGFPIYLGDKKSFYKTQFSQTKKLLQTPAPEAPPLLLSLRFPFASPVFSSLSLPCRVRLCCRGAPGSAWYARWLESRRREGVVRLVRSDFRVWQEAPLLLVGSIARGGGSAVSSVLLRLVASVLPHSVRWMRGV